MEQNKLAYSYDEMMAVLREVNSILVSLHQMGSYYGFNWDKQEYEKETTRFIDECRVTERMADVRAILSSKFDDSLDNEGVSYLERELADLKYWEKPGDMLEEYRSVFDETGDEVD